MKRYQRILRRVQILQMKMIDIRWVCLLKYAKWIELPDCSQEKGSITLLLF